MRKQLNERETFGKLKVLCNDFQGGFYHFTNVVYIGKKHVFVSLKQMDDNEEYKKHREVYYSSDNFDQGDHEQIEEDWYAGAYVSNKVLDHLMIRISVEAYNFIMDEFEVDWEEFFQARQGRSLSDWEHKEYAYRGRKPANYIILS